jgi:SAM-dependent methyltransferase
VAPAGARATDRAGGRAVTDPDAFNAFEAAGWERQVAGYDDFFGPITTRLVEPLLDAAGVGDGTHALDVACGPGYATVAAAGRGAAVVGVDVAEGMLALARRLHPQLDVRRGDAEALPFADGSFDAVFANFLLLHVGRPERVAAELARVLGPGGRVALTVWDVPARSRVVGVLVDAIAAAEAAPPADLPAGPPIFRFSADDEFARLLRESGGLDDVAVRTIAFSHAVPSADALWRGLLGGTVRVSALLVRQPEPVQRRIREAFDRLVEPYRTDAGYELPVSVKLASGGRQSAMSP